MEIDIESTLYKCWHEAGHAVVCLACEGKVKFMEITQDKECKGSARAQCEVNDRIRKYVACGGFAAELLLYKDEKLAVTQETFMNNALRNAHEDKVRFFGEENQPTDDCWPADMDEEFVDFAIREAFPILDDNYKFLEELANALYEKNYLSEAEINRIVE